VFELEARAHPLEELVALAHEVDAVGPGDQPEGDELDPDDDQQRGRDLGVNVEGPAEDRRLRQHGDIDQYAEDDHHAPRDDEQELRAVDQHQPQVAPAVAQR